MAELTRQGAQTEALLADHTESIATAEEQIRKLSDDLEQGDRNWKQLVGTVGYYRLACLLKRLPSIG